jgi:hypothetical protein
MSDGDGTFTALAIGGDGGDLTVNDATPEIDFDDTTATIGAGDIDASINVECETLNDCDMVFAVNSGADSETTVLKIDTETGGASVVEVHEATPTLGFNDADETNADAEVDGQITLACATEGDCEMALGVTANDAMVVGVEIQGVAASDYDVRIGDAAGSNHILVDQAGKASGAGTGAFVQNNGADGGATCTAGEVYLDTDQTTDTNCTTTLDNSFCVCTATDTWTAFENVPALPTITAVTTADTVAPTVAELQKPCGSVVYTNLGDTDGADLTLPDIEAAGVGSCIVFTATAAQVFCLEAAADDDIALGIDAAGVLIGVGESIDSPGAAGNTITLLATSADMWATIAISGVWADGGAACP